MVSLTAVSAAALSAVSVVGAGSDGLSDTSLMKSADFSTAFSGGSASNRVTDDPDAPIRTSRFDEGPAPVIELAGAAPAPTGILPPGAVPPGYAGQATAPVRMAAADAPPSPDAGGLILARVLPRAQPVRGVSGTRTAALPAPGARQAFRPDVTPLGMFAPGRRVSLSLTTGESPLNPGSGLSYGERDSRQNLSVAHIPAKSRLFDTRRLGVQVDVSPESRKEGRWFVFAATSGDAVGFNLFGAPNKTGRKRSSWSVEKLAEYGKIQLGLGWRKGPMQISGVATRREIGAYGQTQEDTVLGLSFTISGGKRLPPPKARRGIPRE